MTELKASEPVQLGTSELQISSMGIGTWSWGDRVIWQYGKGEHSDLDIQEAFELSLKAGINWFDSAEMYGRGKSEKILGKLITQSNPTPYVATKFFPYPWRLDQGALLRAVRKSAERLGILRIALYQIHWPYPPRSPQTWVKALAQAVEAGLTQAVGVSNFNLQQTRQAQKILKASGISLASNQVHFSLLNRKIEKNGLLAYCQEHKITIIAYSPLEMGLLTGKYTPETPPPGLRGKRYNRQYLRKIQPLIQQLKEIGAHHEGRTPAQVSLNWLMRKGVVPIPGAKNSRQAMDNTGAMGWRLTEEEMKLLDQTNPLA